MFFSGQILRWDPDAYWGLAVAGSMAGRVPVIGPWVVDMLLGGADHRRRLAEPLLRAARVRDSRRTAVLPGGPPVAGAASAASARRRVPGEVVDPTTYDAEYRARARSGRAVPRRRAAEGHPVLGPGRDRGRGDRRRRRARRGRPARPIPTLAGANPRPEWPFLWLFALLSLSPPAAETFIMLVFPVLVIVVLLLVPFVSNRGERAPSRRPVAVLAVIVIYTTLGVLTYQGVTRALVAEDDRLDGRSDPRSTSSSAARRVELQGALVFQYKNCRNCHALDGIGGRRGPDLTTVGTRLTRDQLIDQVSNGTPGGGNMPAYGKQISPAEMTSLVDFLVSLRPEGQPPAGWPRRRIAGATTEAATAKSMQP